MTASGRVWLRIHVCIFFCAKAGSICTSIQSNSIIKFIFVFDRLIQSAFMNDPNQTNRLSNKLFGLVSRFGQHFPLSLASRKSALSAARFAILKTIRMENFAFATSRVGGAMWKLEYENRSINRLHVKWEWHFNHNSLLPIADSNTQSSDIYTLSTNSGSENSKTSSSDNLHTSPALRNPNSQSSSVKLGGTPRHSADRSNVSHKSISEGSVSPQANSSYSGGPSVDVYADNQTVINLGKCQGFCSIDSAKSIKFADFSGQIWKPLESRHRIRRRVWHFCLGALRVVRALQPHRVSSTCSRPAIVHFGPAKSLCELCSPISRFRQKRKLRVSCLKRLTKTWRSCCSAAKTRNSINCCPRSVPWPSIAYRHYFWRCWHGTSVNCPTQKSKATWSEWRRWRPNRTLTSTCNCNGEKRPSNSFSAWRWLRYSNNCLSIRATKIL